MAKEELFSEIVQSGTWLYDQTVQTEVWIVKQNFEYWYESEYSDEPERLNADGENFQVLFVRGDRRLLGPNKLSLEEAVAAAEESLRGKELAWTNHLRQRLYGGRRYCLAPCE